MAETPLAIALVDAAGLCESEARRTRSDPKTSDHWKQVAIQLRAHIATIGPLAPIPDCDPMRVGSEPCGVCERCKARTARIVDTLVTLSHDEANRV